MAKSRNQNFNAIFLQLIETLPTQKSIQKMIGILNKALINRQTALLKQSQLQQPDVKTPKCKFKAKAANEMGKKGMMLMSN